MKTRILWALAIVLNLLAIAGAERADIYIERGTGYTLLYSQGSYIVGFGSAAPAIQGAFGTTGHNIPDNGLFYRTDLGTFYTVSSGALAASSFAGQTFTTTTLTSPTVTTPSITSPTITGSAGTGFSIVKKCTLTETGVAGPYTCTIPIPAGAVIEDIQVIGRVLWNGTSASLDVGDTADPNGYFTAVDLKATDLVIGEMLSVKHGDLWGGQEGAYIVAASGRRGPTSSNFSMSYVAGSNILFAVTAGAADGSTGRTDCVVIYSTGEVITQTTS